MLSTQSTLMSSESDPKVIDNEDVEQMGGFTIELNDKITAQVLLQAFFGGNLDCIKLGNSFNFALSFPRNLVL